jgi:hypothetical protein
MRMERIRVIRGVRVIRQFSPWPRRNEAHHRLRIGSRASAVSTSARISTLSVGSR